MNRKIFVIFPVIFLLSSCATSYRSQGFFSDGYSEIVTNQDSFIVTFKGNEYTNQETALKFALLRASELTISHGYKYFVVLSSTDQSSVYNYTSAHSEGTLAASTYKSKASVKESGSSTTYSGAVIKPGTTLRIKCYSEEPQSVDAIDAYFFWEANRTS